jgi:predicted nucleotidyltransferase
MLSEQQINIIINEMKPFNPNKIGIFGSAARNENSTESDIDILYEFNDNYNLFDLGGLLVNLEAALGKEVDLVEMNHIHPVLKDRILSDVKMIYER